MNSELLLNIINTVFSGFSVIFIIFGWIIPYKQSQKQQREQRHYEESLKSEQNYKDRIDEQIAKLYVPLFSFSMENKMQTNILFKKLNRNYVFAKGETINNLNDNDKFLWIDFVKNHFLPNLNRMKEILNSNMHLIYETELPSSYQRFIKYTLKLNNDLELYLNSSNENYENLFVEDNYPSDFDIYINKTLEKLLQFQRNYVTHSDENTIISKTNFDINISNIDSGETVLLFDNNESPYLLNDSHTQKITIDKSQFTIGRSPECNYILSNALVSRIHLMIVKEDSCWYIIILGLNGAYINNKQLSLNSKTPLHDGDIIKIIDTNFSFHL